jgi:hypothetical protein
MTEHTIPKGALELNILKISPGDSVVSSLAPKGRHMRSNPQLPLVPSEADPEKIIKKGKASHFFFCCFYKCFWLVA